MLWLRNTLLAVASLVFYAYGEPVYIVVMIASVTVNYFAALIISKLSGKARSAVCALAVIIDIAALCFFKYVPWLVRVIDSAAGLSIPVPGFTIPVGISFFPQLIAGPIVKYGDICAQLSSREVTVERTSLGIRRFIFGLSKKVLVSNTAAVLAKAAFEASSPSSLMAWSGAIAYCIQLYFDFSGYSDMAIGLASMFGFDLPQNFNYPYFAVTIRDFWKRWHISLTSWFREYVYIPLGGNRKGRARTIVNRLAVFFLTGLWHGANFTFILWGMWHGLLMMLEQFAGFDKLREKKALRPVLRIYTLLAVLLGFVVFNSASVSSAFSYIGRMFSFSGNPSDALGDFSPYLVIMMIAGIVFSLPVVPKLRGMFSRDGKLVPAAEFVSYAVTIPLLAMCVMSLASSSFNPFIYYTF